MKINEALSAVMADIGAVDKGGYNKVQSYSYRGVDAVVNAVSPALKKHGVVVMPVESSIEYVERTNKNGNAVIDARARVTYRWIGPEGDWLDSTVCSEGRDTSDKSSTKAMSVAFRTCLLQTLALPTDDEDPDETYHEVPSSSNGLDAAKAKSALKAPVDQDALKVVLAAIQTDAKAAGVPDTRVAELASQAGIKGRISACRDLAALQKLSDLVRLENG